MRVWGATCLMAVAVGTAAAASSSPPIAVHSDLYYATVTPCAALDMLSTHQDLSGELLPNERFDGTAKITKSTATSSAGCVVHLQVDGELEVDGIHDMFALADKADESLAKLVAAHVLRGSEGLKDLTLQRLHVKLGNREYSIDAQAASEDTAGELTLRGGNCDDFASKALLEDLFPSGAGEVAVVPGDVGTVDCAVGLHVLGRSPSVSSTSDAIAFLKSVDDILNDWFGVHATKQSTAKLSTARLAFSPPKTMLEAAVADTVTNTMVAHSQLNAPTKQITVGILVGISMLTAMLAGVVYLKKRHEQNQKERYSNASRAAQIRRVSYRMGYERVRGLDSEYGAEEEEKDGLL